MDEVTGAVHDVISTSERLAQVTFEHQDVYMYFRGPWRDRTKILKKGDDITVIGQIQQIDALDLHLDNSELVDLTAGKAALPPSKLSAPAPETAPATSGVSTQREQSARQTHTGQHHPR